VGGLSPDHIHLLLSVPPSISLSKLLQYIKGKSGRKLLMEFEHLRKRYWGQHLWARGYFAVTVGNVNQEDIQKYIEEQELHHKKDDFRISEYELLSVNPFCKRLPTYHLKAVVIEEW
jgi:putative transposase